MIISDSGTSSITYQSSLWVTATPGQTEIFMFVLEGDLKKKSDKGFYNMTYSKIYAIPGETYGIFTLNKL